MKNIFFIIACVLFALLLPFEYLGLTYWIISLFGLIIPFYCIYHLRINWIAWLILQVLGMPFIFASYLLIVKNWEQTLPILSTYVLCAVIFTFSCSFRTFQKDKELLLTKKLREAHSKYLIVEGQYHDGTHDKTNEMRFIVKDDYVATAYDQSLFTNDPFVVEFTLQDANDICYQFKPDKTLTKKTLEEWISLVCRPYRRDYSCKSSNTTMTISKKGLIILPDGDSAYWNWNIRNHPIILHTEKKSKISFFLYGNKSLCSIEGNTSHEFRVASMALLFFFRTLYSKTM